MSLAVGARVGVYEIASVLGAGGMGEVYRARDTKLGRDVALKILPEAFAGDPERLARFEREAKTLASLNHPHIAQIYGFEQSPTGSGHAMVSALVMELVEGDDLSRRIARGALPLDETLSIAKQIADALEAAHERGIVHRDLKPANIKIRADGTVKVLDFGLAKAMEPGTGDDSDHRSTGPNSPTLTSPAVTRHGVLLGTAAYMSPEQARGRAVDRRADVWAFGCVLYEMLTGRIAFGADTMTDILSAIVSREPDWAALPHDTPAAIQRLLRRCLAKDARQRLRDLGDARLELDDAGSMDKPPATPGAAPSSFGARLGWLAVGALIAAGGFLAAPSWMSRDTPATEGVQLHRITDAVGNEESSSLSPDGKTVAFVAPGNGRRQIWIRLLGGGAALQLTRDDADHHEPRWMSDSASILYFTAGRTAEEPGTLWEIPALGGAPRRLSSAVSGGDASHDGRRIAAFQLQDGHTVLVSASRDGTSTQRVAVLASGSIYDFPRWSPDDRQIAYLATHNFEFDMRLYVVDLAGGMPREIARADYIQGLSWTGDGSGIVYSSSQGSTLLYPPTFNLRVVAVDGSRDRQVTFGDVSYIEPDVHPSLGVTASRIRSQSDIWKVPVDGLPADNVRKAARLTRQTGVAQIPAVSPDEREVLYLSDNGGHANLWIAATDGSGARQITFEQDPRVSIGVPTWSPTSNQIAFFLTRAGTARQWLINSDGSGLRELMNGLWAYWSPDGRWLYDVVLHDGLYRIQKVLVEGGAPVLVRADDAAAPSVASDGTLFFCKPLRGPSGATEWVLHRARPENGAATVVARFSGARVPVEANNAHPILSPDGQWLVQPLIDGATTNLWLIGASDGAMHRITDFGERSVIIARRVSWSRDSKHVYAAIADTDADIVLLKNVLPQ